MASVINTRNDRFLKFRLWTYVPLLEGLFLMMIKLVGNTIMYGNFR